MSTSATRLITNNAQPGPPGMNSKQYLEWLLGQNNEALAGQKKDAADHGYYDARQKNADVNADWWNNRNREELGKLGTEADAGPTNGTFSFRDHTDPTYDGGPQAPTVSPYDSWMAEHGGRTGNTQEGDLSQYGDKNYYLGDKSQLPDYLRAALEDKGGTDIGSPDFDGQFERYAGAANNKFQRTLGLQTDSLVGNAQARGRFNSGFLDEDYGNLARSLAGDARDDVDSHAIDVLGLQEQDASSRRSTAASRTSSRGQLALDSANLMRNAGEDAAQGGATQATQARANRAELRGQYQDERDTGEKTFEDRRDTGRANFESDRTYGRNAYTNDRDFAYKGFGDNRADAYNRRDYATKAYGDAAKSAQDESDTGYNRAEDQRNRYLDLLTGTTDRATGLYNANQQRKAQFYNSLIGGASAVAGAFAGK